MIDEIIAAYKYNFAENSALRFTVNASGLFTDKETETNEEIDRTYDSLNYYENIQNISSNQFYEVKVQYLYELHLNKIVTIFFGVGPFGTLEFNHREDSRTVKYYNSNYEDVSSAVWSFTETIWSAGWSVLIGLECKVYKNINLLPSDFSAPAYAGTHALYNYVFGFNNSVGTESFAGFSSVVGAYNSIQSQFCSVCGFYNVIMPLGELISVFGGGNWTLDSSVLCRVAGQSNSYSGLGLDIFGVDNVITGTDSRVFGTSNIGSADTELVAIYGTNNTIGASVGFGGIFGTDNQIADYKMKFEVFGDLNSLGARCESNTVWGFCSSAEPDRSARPAPSLQ